MSPVVRDGSNRLTTYENPLPASNPSGPVERLVEPSMVRVPEVTGKTNAEYMAASRARGAKAGGFVKGVTKPHLVAVPPKVTTPTKAPSPRTGAKRSPEAKERMRLAMIASWERRRGALATIEPQGREADVPATDVATVEPPAAEPATEVATPPGPLGLAEMAAAIDAALTPDFQPRPLEGEDRCAWARFLQGSTVVQLCDRISGHAGLHRGRLYSVLVTAKEIELLGHAVASAS